MNILKELERLITEHGSSSILRDHLALFRDKVSDLEKENKNLKRGLAQAHKEISNLRSQLENKSITDDFVEHRGIFFKRKPGGGYHHAAFCPRCHMIMAALEDWMPCSCESCKIITPFTAHDLPRILKEI